VLVECIAIPTVHPTILPRLDLPLPSMDMLEAGDPLASFLVFLAQWGAKHGIPKKPTGERWLLHGWSKWAHWVEGERTSSRMKELAPTKGPGLYRVAYTMKFPRSGLLYIGETGNLQDRLEDLSNSCNAGVKVFRQLRGPVDNPEHDAGYEIGKFAAEHDIWPSVSWSDAPAYYKDRRDLEDKLQVAHREFFGWRPALKVGGKGGDIVNVIKAAKYEWREGS